VNAIHFINALKAQGCRFALDDFGSDLSSFAYLKTLPVDYVKIDGAFVKDIATEPTSFAIVKAMHEIAQVMGKQTIAEFVESALILEKLHEIGVDYAQGYFIGRPQPLQRW
jgi:Amt family ammonium transporter